MNRSIVAITIGLSAQLAVAEPVNKPAGKAAYAEGKKKYAEGDYLGAAASFDQAFRNDPDPAYIFNVGQAYRRRAEAKSGILEEDCFKSMTAYRQFLELIAEPPNRKEVDTYIKEMERCAGKLALEPVKPVDKPIDKPIHKPIDTPIERPIDKPIESSRDPKQLVGIGLGAAGVVACGFGIYFARLGARKAKEHDAIITTANERPNGQMDLTPTELSALEVLDEEGHSADVKTYVAFGVGGAMVIGGTLLYLFSSSSTEQKVTVAPSRDGAMVFGSFRF
ncbi:MAG: hypothetical protein H0V17_29060 [Deltaproteobacteria bacterium]|nr:hypothetical protein [Deltaproteobacteria bacterium]